jgi:predicted metal-dependent phosphoesterase TrpH
LNLKIDLHIHSYFSDGRGSPDEIIDFAKINGLDGLSITDHETLDGYYEAREIESNLLLIPWYEVETKAGHVLVLGLEELPPSEESIGYEELIEWVRNHRGLSILAHPAIERPQYDKWIHFPPDAVEVLNASYPIRYFVDRGLEISDRLNVTSVGGSDAHSLPVIGNAFTVVDVQNPNISNVLNAIKRGSAWYEGDISSIGYRIRMSLGYITGALQQNMFSWLHHKKSILIHENAFTIRAICFTRYIF